MESVESAIFTRRQDLRSIHGDRMNHFFTRCKRRIQMRNIRSFSAVAIALLFTFSLPKAASAAEIRVLCSNGLKAVMEDLAPQFERATGNKVVMTFGLAAEFKQRIEKGEAVDVAVLTPPLIDDLIKQGKMAADSRAVIARTGLGIMIRAGARKPDVGTT